MPKPRRKKKFKSLPSTSGFGYFCAQRPKIEMVALRRSWASIGKAAQREFIALANKDLDEWERRHGPLEEHIDVLPVFKAAFRPCTGTVVCVALFPH